MANASVKVFISYSRNDSDFVNRLEADLVARNFGTWVDRLKLEGGGNWAEEIQKAIDGCQVVLVVITPDSLDSPWVQKEYIYAVNERKLVIPLLLKHVSKIPLALGNIQATDFRSNYSQGLDDLLIVLTAIEITSEIPQQSQQEFQRIPITNDPFQGRDSDASGIIPAPPLPQPPPDLLFLYRAGIEAKAIGDLDRAAILWQQILDKEPEFYSGFLQKQMKDLNEALLPIRKGRLRERAKQAEQESEWNQAIGAWRALIDLDPLDAEGQAGLRGTIRKRAEKACSEGLWGEEIGAWDALLKLDPQDKEAHEYRAIAEQNLRGDLQYSIAVEFIDKGNISAAREALVELWQLAPYYGDPRGIAKIAGIAVPPGFEETQKINPLRERAESFYQLGDWNKEIETWESILMLKPNDEQAMERLEVAKQNREHAQKYNEIASLSWGYTPSQRVKKLLEEFWKLAPYYGDPRGLANKWEVTAPSGFVKGRVDPSIMLEAQKTMLRNTANEYHTQDKWDDEITALEAWSQLDPQNLEVQKRLSIARQLLIDKQEQLNKQSQQEAENQRRIAQQRENLRMHHPRAFYIKYKLHSSFIEVALGFMAVLIGGGGFVVGYSQSWLAGIITLASIAVLGFALGYRKALTLPDWIILLLLSTTIVGGLWWYLWGLQLKVDQPYISHIWIFGDKKFWMNRQLAFGMVTGFFAGLSCASYFGSRVFSYIGKNVLFGGVFLGLGTGLVGWLVLGLLSLFGSGFGFGYGWSYSLLLGVPLGVFTGVGFVIFVYILFNPKY